MHHLGLPWLCCELLSLRSDGIKYLAAYQERQAGFTPLCFSVDGMLKTEAVFLCTDVLFAGARGH